MECTYLFLFVGVTEIQMQKYSKFIKKGNVASDFVVSMKNNVEIASSITPIRALELESLL